LPLFFMQEFAKPWSFKSFFFLSFFFFFRGTNEEEIHCEDWSIKFDSQKCQCRLWWGGCLTEHMKTKTSVIQYSLHRAQWNMDRWYIVINYNQVGPLGMGKERGEGEGGGHKCSRPKKGVPLCHCLQISPPQPHACSNRCK
jgi:hypothetical protein